MTSPEHLHRVTRWLNDLSRLTPNQPDVADRLPAIAAMLADNFQADAAFCRASLDHVAQQCRFFPSYAEAYQALGAWWKEHRPMRPALPAPAPPPEREAPSDDQIARNQTLVREVAATLKDTEETRASRSFAVAGQSRNGHLSDGQLLAAYEKLAADGDRLAFTRLAMLRKKLAQAE